MTRYRFVVVGYEGVYLRCEAFATFDSSPVASSAPAACLFVMTKMRPSYQFAIQERIDLTEHLFADHCAIVPILLANYRNRKKRRKIFNSKIKNDLNSLAEPSNLRSF
jgi:hypothetical protein